jgi:protein CpxP
MKFNPKLALKSLALALGSLFLAFPVALAGDEAAPGGERRERLQHGADRMAEELGLSDAQKGQIKELAQKEKAELDALRGSEVQDKEGRRAQARAIREKYREQRHAILTPEQRVKADKMREKFEKGRDRMDRRGERGEGGEGGEGGGKRREKPAS